MQSALSHTERLTKVYLINVADAYDQFYIHIWRINIVWESQNLCLFILLDPKGSGSGPGATLKISNLLLLKSAVVYPILQDAVTSNGDLGKMITYLKVDVEGGELKSIHEWITSGILDYVRQGPMLQNSYLPLLIFHDLLTISR